MVLVSALLMYVVSLATAKPSQATVEKYFPSRPAAPPVVTARTA
jgi:hypothetical protein